jgi:hypothetical protein
VETAKQQWDPFQMPESTEDAYNTLFVGRLVRFIIFVLQDQFYIKSLETDEQKLKKEMEQFGPVKKVVYYIY